MTKKEAFFDPTEPPNNTTTKNPKTQKKKNKKNKKTKKTQKKGLFPPPPAPPPPPCITSTPETIRKCSFGINYPQNAHEKPSPDCTPPTMEQGSWEKCAKFALRNCQKCLLGG